MYKDLFNAVLGLVSEVTGISKEDILSGSHRADIVDARCLFVHFLFKEGVYPTVIASMMKKSSAGVRHLLAGFDNRKTSNKLFSNISEEIEKKLESKFCPAC